MRKYKMVSHGHNGVQRVKQNSPVGNLAVYACACYLGKSLFEEKQKNNTQTIQRLNTVCSGV